MQELGKIDKELAVAKQDMAAVIANEKIKMEMDYRLSALSGALGIDQQAAAELAGLTNLSVQEAALKFGLQAEQVMQLRQMTMLQSMQQALGAQQAGYAQDLMNQQGQISKDLMSQQGDIWKQIMNLQVKTGA
jgi:DNA-directed RNA polymerase specialized sigma24 family protein